MLKILDRSVSDNYTFMFIFFAFLATRPQKMSCSIYVSIKFVQVIDFKMAIGVGILNCLNRKKSLSNVLGKKIAVCVYSLKLSG